MNEFDLSKQFDYIGLFFELDCLKARDLKLFTEGLRGIDLDLGVTYSH
jgi:hypothetical protein